MNIKKELLNAILASDILEIKRLLAQDPNLLNCEFTIEDIPIYLKDQRQNSLGEDFKKKYSTIIPGTTPLILAAKELKGEVVEFLLSQKNIASIEKAFKLAIVSEHYEAYKTYPSSYYYPVVKAFLTKSNINLESYYGDLAIYLFYSKQSHEFFKRLIEENILPKECLNSIFDHILSIYKDKFFIHQGIIKITEEVKSFSEYVLAEKSYEKLVKKYKEQPPFLYKAPKSYGEVLTKAKLHEAEMQLLKLHKDADKNLKIKLTEIEKVTLQLFFQESIIPFCELLLLNGADINHRKFLSETLFQKIVKIEPLQKEWILNLINNWEADPTIIQRDKLSKEAIDLLEPYLLKPITKFERYVKPAAAIIMQTIYNIITTPFSPFLFAVSNGKYWYKEFKDNSTNPLVVTFAAIMGIAGGIVGALNGTFYSPIFYEIKVLYNNIYRTMICGERHLSEVSAGIGSTKEKVRDIRDFMAGATDPTDSNSLDNVFIQTNFGAQVMDSLITSVVTNFNVSSTKVPYISPALS